jgi:hypothetical protein
LQGRCDLRKKVRRDRGNDANAHFSAKRILARASERLQVGSFGQDSLCPSEEFTTGQGDEHAASIALKQPHTDDVLELGKLGAQRWLRDMTPLSGFSKAACLGHRYGVFELSKRVGNRSHD